MTTAPCDAIEAVTHPDPYPFYARLRARGPLHRDESIGLWIAAGAEAVAAVLGSDACRVRPPSEPVPAALADSAAGEIFRQLVRMNDGAGHCPLKAAVSATLESVDWQRLATLSRRCAHALALRLRPQDDPARITDFALLLPAHVMASLLGVPPDRLDAVAGWLKEFVACLAPAGGAEPRERGTLAAAGLRKLFRDLLERGEAADGLLSALAEAARRAGVYETDRITANGIGFLSQAYEATAGLIGNTLVALARDGQLREELAAEPGRLAAVVQTVLRLDPPIQNTRRFVAADTVIAGQSLRAGDSVLVVLAAANRDPDAEQHPGRFDTDRPGRRLLSFGAGAHACPGTQLAAAIAEAGVAQLLALGVDPARLLNGLSYRASVNARIPVFGAPATCGQEAAQ